MTQIDSIYFEDMGMCWVTERWQDDKGTVICENTHPVYDNEGNPVRI